MLLFWPAIVRASVFLLWIPFLNYAQLILYAINPFCCLNIHILLLSIYAFFGGGPFYCYVVFSFTGRSKQTVFRFFTLFIVSKNWCIYAVLIAGESSFSFFF